MDEPSDTARHRAQRTAVAPARVRQLSAWIDAHIAERISLQELCELAGVGGRSLQKAFRSVHRTSPMDYVLERRLIAARRLLTEPSSEQGVTSIATACGFTHFGRFALRYREAYGESPSVTLSRYRSAGRPRSVTVEGGRHGIVTKLPFALDSQT